MKKKAVFLAVIMAVSSLNIHAFDLKDLLGGSGSTVSNMIEGVFSRSNIEVEDLAGEWTASGSAVCFKSDNFLKKAGGVAAAAAVETKLDPYFKQYGLTGAVFTIKPDGSFTLNVKKISLEGSIEKSGEGMFDFTFKALGKLPLGSFPAYVQKTSTSMDIMFDADKLRKLISVVASFSGSSLTKTASSLLDSYDGLCVGFKLDKTGTVAGEKKSGSVISDLFGGKKSGSTTKSGSSGTKSGSSSKSTKNTDESKTSSGSGATDILKDIFKKKK